MSEHYPVSRLDSPQGPIRRFMTAAGKELYQNRSYYLFLIPGVLYYLVFRYSPLYFLQIAFRDYRITRAISDSPWVGLYHFQTLFASRGFLNALSNTVVLSIMKLAFDWPAPIILALLLNEVTSTRFKKMVQTIIYLPHFISWVIIGGLVINILSVSGPVNQFLQARGLEPIRFMTEQRLFRPIIVASDVWKGVGWGTILYLASISRIPPELYESAYMDGAGRFQRMFYITIPGIKDVVVVLLILRLGNLLNVGFEQILVMYNPLVYNVGDVLDTFVYRLGLLQRRYSFATAAGLFKSAVAGIMLFLSDRAAKATGERGLF